MNVTSPQAQLIASALGTDICSFPQTYLGLPLSPTKLAPSAFQPLIDRIDKYLAGWCASLLSKGGRLTLLSAVLDSLPTHFMASLFISLLLIEKIDKKRRAFFWAGEDSCLDAQCLVAWSRACMPKKSAGLGIKNLHVQNIWLLLKFSFKTLQQENTPWRRWIPDLSPYPFSQGPQSSSLGKTISKSFETLTAITQYSVINGKILSSGLIDGFCMSL
jgi:hypothetical protein